MDSSASSSTNRPLPSSPPPSYRSTDIPLSSGGPSHLSLAEARLQEAQDRRGDGHDQRGTTVEDELDSLDSTREVSTEDASILRRKRVDSNAGSSPTRKHSSSRRGLGDRPSSNRPAGSRDNPISLDSSPSAPSARNGRPPATLQSRASSYTLPSWQPDEAVAECPVCRRAFSWINRKHHCRRCGQVVCANCSPHRITMPRQYIVRHPADVRAQNSALAGIASITGMVEGLNSSPSLPTNLGGGEVVRVCNPCVPDPNPHPPQLAPRSSRPHWQTPTNDQTANEQRHTQEPSMTLREALNPRAQNSGGSHSQLPPHLVQQFGFPPSMESQSRMRSLSDFQRRVFDTPDHSLPQLPVQRSNSQSISARRAHAHSLFQRYRGREDESEPLLFSARQEGLRGSQESLPPLPSSSTHGTPGFHGRSSSAASHASAAAGPSAIWPRRVPPPVREEDQCPICFRELPSKGPNNDTTARERHIETCIQRSSAQFSTSTPADSLHAAQAPNPLVGPARHRSRGSSFRSPPVPDVPVEAARPRMIVYQATEKDCTAGDGSTRECVICLEDFEVGENIGRLECFCIFHQSCIVDWWNRKGPGSCPTHQIQI